MDIHGDSLIIPDWLKLGEQIDVFDDETGRWYGGVLKRMRQVPGDLHFIVAYPDFKAEELKYSKVHMKIREHVVERILDTRQPKLPRIQAIHLNKGESVIYVNPQSGEEEELKITVNDPMNGMVQFENGNISGYEFLAPLPDLEAIPEDNIYATLSPDSSPEQRKRKATPKESATPATLPNESPKQRKRKTTPKESPVKVDPPKKTKTNRSLSKSFDQSKLEQNKSSKSANVTAKPAKPAAGLAVVLSISKPSFPPPEEILTPDVPDTLTSSDNVNPQCEQLQPINIMTQQAYSTHNLQDASVQCDIMSAMSLQSELSSINSNVKKVQADIVGLNQSASKLENQMQLVLEACMSKQQAFNVSDYVPRNTSRSSQSTSTPSQSKKSMPNFSFLQLLQDDTIDLPNQCNLFQEENLVSNSHSMPSMSNNLHTTATGFQSASANAAPSTVAGVQSDGYTGGYTATGFQSANAVPSTSAAPSTVAGVQSDGYSGGYTATGYQSANAAPSTSAAPSTVAGMQSDGYTGVIGSSSLNQPSAGSMITPVQSVTCSSVNVASRPLTQASTSTSTMVARNVSSSNPRAKSWKMTKVQSVSRVNFAWLVCEKIFTREEMQNRNCRGKKREGLNPEKLILVKEITFDHYPVTDSESEYSAWRKCEINIDSYLRASYRS